MTTVINFPTAPDNTLAEPDWSRWFTEPAEIVRAGEVWRCVVAEMTSAGTVTPANAEAITRYAVAVLTFDRAAAEIGKSGPVIKAKRSGTPAHNAWWTVLRDADLMCSAAEAKLGLSPQARGKATPAKRGPRKPSAADQYLKPRA